MKKTITIISMLIIISMLSIVANADTSAISLSLVNQDPDPAVAGDIVELRIAVTNDGSEAANNMIVELEPSYPFESLPGEDYSQEVGTILGKQGINSDDTKIIKFKVNLNKDATAGSYDLNLKYYKSGSTVSVKDTISVDLESKDSAEIIHINQIELIPGKITPITFKINNVGSTPLRDLTFSWENEQDIILPVGSDNTKYIKYIEIGETKDLEFNVIASANADPDLYKLDLALSYDDPTTKTNKKIETKAGVYVGGSTDFDAAFSGTSSNEYSFAVSNIGSVSASSVTVKIPNQNNWKVTGSNSVIIGNLNEGDYTIASFKLQNKNLNTPTTDSQDTSTKQHNQDSSINLEIVYTDSRGNRKTINKTVFIDSSVISTNVNSIRDARMAELESNSSSTSTWIYTGIAIILLFIILKVNKRHKIKKINNKNYTYLKATKDVLTFQK